ncbi:ATP-dependent zinc protease [Gracilimonas sp. Q87]|uniref:ATP-dependent zinc protease family protein n=1 Tax=Gracilimonas sp. Q87 TaxID=3384766 RepID=UPI00398446F1
MPKQKIIGRTELVDLPEWNFNDLEAKIDTGAYTSSLHCHDIEAFEKNGESWIKFFLLDPDHEAYNKQEIIMPVHDKREVKSSNGESELRYIVKTKVLFFKDPYIIEFSLTDRSAMKYPLLIGRKFLQKGPFLVDVTKENLNNLKK